MFSKSKYKVTPHEYIKRNWLLVALLTCIFLAGIYPKFGSKEGPLHTQYSVKYGAICMIFFISGLTLKTASVFHTFQQYKLHIFIQTFAFILIPVVTQVFVKFLNLFAVNTWILRGLIIVSCMPPPVSSAVILTRTAKGNETASIFNSVLGSFLGNESCDLDSTVCSLAYGYYLSEKLNVKKIKDVAVFPIINVPSDEFPSRTEHCSLLKDINVDLKKLIYRSEINVNEIISEKKNYVKTCLVDHHVLNKNDELLKDTVNEIFDHRPLDQSTHWSSQVKMRIELVGSCATLIADELLREEGILFKELAYLLYCTIVFDTLAVLPENKKATALDIATVKTLEDKFSFMESKVTLFQKIVDLHADISKLTLDQLLIRDLKFVNNIPIAGLPMLVETFSKLPGADLSLKQMGIKKKTSFIVLVGIEAKPDVKRDIGIFLVKDDAKLMKLIVDNFKSHEDFKFVEISSEMSNLTILKHNNIEKSRKQIMPIVKDFLDTTLSQ
ncbi:exopolyphosphatase PRUNE1 isoform X1 [Harmonia axyridis]|uniref:exopolyphosphatase PRUNE1 isoform X1 n=1 Tax=Harmonia axyridis TaxID=115357 RepID=UPI001E278CD1|nr:exopolyphosphatase PRUNE1 isoform X1 [Harmonia axyridis]